MYNNQSNYAQQFMPNPLTAASGSTTITIKPPAPPAQRPSEFATAILQQAEELNGRLENLRYRLFGDSDPKSEATEKSLPSPEISLEAAIQTAHFELNRALAQIDAVQNRL